MGMFVTKDEAAARLAICFACTELTETVPRRCLVCNCYMRAKVQLRGASCPQKKWAAGAFIAQAAVNAAEYWREENAVIEGDMQSVPPEQAEYALSSNWPPGAN